MPLVLDAGALIAVDRQDRSIGVILRLAHQEQLPVRTSAAVVAQVWRGGGRQANLARVLAGIDAVGLDDSAGRSVGALLQQSRTDDVAHGHLTLVVQPGDVVLTSDPDDINAILGARAVEAAVRSI